MNLYWTPINKTGTKIPESLRTIIRMRNRENSIFTERDVFYLQGLADAGIEGAESLLGAIAKYGKIEVYEGN